MKTNLLFNQSFGTVGSPNQTGETLTRENRIGLMSYLRRTLMLLFAVLTLSMANVGMVWGAASTSSDGKYVTGIVNFSSVGTLSTQTNYWHNGVKFYCYNSQSVSASTSSWSESVSQPAYISGKTAGNKANTSNKWGSNGSDGKGVQYTMSGLTCNQYCMGIHVNKACTVVVVVDKNIGSYTDDASMTASVDATAYGTGWTSSNYKTAGTALTVTSSRAAAATAPGRYTLRIPVTAGEKVVKIFNSSSGSGSGKLFCFESVLLEAAVTHTLTNVTKRNGQTKDTLGVVYNATFAAADGYTLPSTITVTIGGSAATAGTDYTWNSSTGAFQVSAEKVTGAIAVTIVGEAAAVCTAPDHVDISGTWGRFGGEDISLTAAAYSSAGTGSPIADGNITGWQWQKLIGSTWTNVSNGTVGTVVTSGATTKNLQISNCGQGNSGKYRCVVSTGATCSTPSATATDGSEGFGVKVYTLECYTGGTTAYNFTRDGNNDRGSVDVTLAARAEGHEFKIHADDYYGATGNIYEDEDDWVFTTSGDNVNVHPGLGGTFTFTIDYSSNGAEPVLEVTYPRKTVYLVPNSDWKTNSAKFAFNYFRSGGSGGWTSLLSASVCDASVYPATIPQWDGIQIIGVRLSDDATVGTWDKKWNQTQDLTLSSNDKVAISDWNSATYNSDYVAPTYTISFAANGGSGTMTSLSSIACDADKAVTANSFTKTGYSFAGWKANVDVKINGSTVSAGTVINDKITIQNIRSNITLTAQWSVNSYDLTWNLGGGTTTSAGTGIASGVSVNTTSSVAYGSDGNKG